MVEQIKFYFFAYFTHIRLRLCHARQTLNHHQLKIRGPDSSNFRKPRVEVSRKIVQGQVKSFQWPISFIELKIFTKKYRKAFLIGQKNFFRRLRFNTFTKFDISYFFELIGGVNQSEKMPSEPFFHFNHFDTKLSLIEFSKI